MPEAGLEPTRELSPRVSSGEERASKSEASGRIQYDSALGFIFRYRPSASSAPACGRRRASRRPRLTLSNAATSASVSSSKWLRRAACASFSSARSFGTCLSRDPRAFRSAHHARALLNRAATANRCGWPRHARVHLDLDSPSSIPTPASTATSIPNLVAMASRTASPAEHSATVRTLRGSKRATGSRESSV